MAPMTGRSLRRLAVVAALPLIIAGLPLAAGADPEPDDEPVVPLGVEEDADLVEVVVDDQAGVIDLIAAGADVTEYARPVPGGLEVHVVATQAEQDELRALGFAVDGAVVTAEETDAVVAERDAAIERLDQISALATDTLTVLRSEWFTSIGGVTYLNIEVKSSTGADSSTVLTVSWDGGSRTMSRFVDAGQYLYHRFNEPIAVDDVPAEVTITSSMGGVTTAPVVEWLGEPRKGEGPHVATGFVDHYMDPRRSTSGSRSSPRSSPSLPR